MGDIRIVESEDGITYPMSELFTNYYEVTKDLDYKFLGMAYDIKKSAHSEYQDKIMRVGCIIVKDGEMISSGYNTNGIHAEESAILKCMEKEIDMKDSILYSTFQPCTICADFIARSGIKKVVYIWQYPYSYREKNGKKVDFQKMLCQYDIISLIIQPVPRSNKTCGLLTIIPCCCEPHSNIQREELSKKRLENKI